MLPLLLRATGAVGFGALGWGLCLHFGLSSMRGEPFLPWGLTFVAVGIAAGGLVMPQLILGPGRSWARYLVDLPGATLVAAVAGLVIGLIVASLVSIPIFPLEGIVGWALPLALSLVFGAGGMWLGMQRERDVRAIFPGLDASSPRMSHPREDAAPASVAALEPLTESHSGREHRNGAILVDTSAIIDGRIADLTVTGFISGSLLVPRFVLDELRHIADSSDSLRRNRGRRGLEVLGRLRKDASVPLQVLDVGVENGEEVDAQLVELARGMKSSILTTDYNLNRVAEIQGVKVLNVNELANAVKSIVLPGESMRVEIVQEGKEAGQGVAYLDDGTMIVVEGGRRFISSSQEVQVTRVLQTAAGRIIFAQPRAG